MRGSACGGPTGVTLNVTAEGRGVTIFVPKRARQGACGHDPRTMTVARKLQSKRPSSMTPPACRSKQRGFTLAELLAVVVIVGILATLATVGLRKYIFAAKSSEATNMIGSIKAAEEAFRNETYAYLNVSSSINTYYPNDPPGEYKRNWGYPSGNDYKKWMELGVQATGPVQYGYAVVAGAAGATPPDPGTKQKMTWPKTTEPWYVVKAAGDVDGNGVQSIFVSSSFTNRIYSENETE